MITQNENEGIDFDYNLNILSCPDWDDAKSIKEAVRIAFNKILRSQGFTDAEDSTSSITTKPMCFKNSPEIEFKIDVCIETKIMPENGKFTKKQVIASMNDTFGMLPHILKITKKKHGK